LFEALYIATEHSKLSFLFKLCFILAFAWKFMFYGEREVSLPGVEQIESSNYRAEKERFSPRIKLRFVGGEEGGKVGSLRGLVYRVVVAAHVLCVYGGFGGNSQKLEENERKKERK
jgi:hypothetical protein